MTRRDVTRSQVELLLMREAGLAEHYGRLFERAAAGQDLVAAPAVIGRWCPEAEVGAECRRTFDSGH